MGKDFFNPHLRKFSIRKLNVVFVLSFLSTSASFGATAAVSLMRLFLLGLKQGF